MIHRQWRRCVLGTKQRIWIFCVLAAARFCWPAACAKRRAALSMVACGRST
jgi:hypothetical protein